MQHNNYSLYRKQSNYVLKLEKPSAHAADSFYCLDGDRSYEEVIREHKNCKKQRRNHRKKAGNKVTKRQTLQKCASKLAQRQASMEANQF